MRASIVDVDAFGGEETQRSRGMLDFSWNADGHIVTTLGAAKSLISEEARALAWCRLMGPSHGTLRINFLELRTFIC